MSGSEGEGGSGDSGSLAAIERRLDGLERLVSTIRLRQVAWEVRHDPASLLAGVAGARRVVRDDLDDLAEVLARWESPLTPEELGLLRGAVLVAQAVTGQQAVKLHLVVADVVDEVGEADVERALELASILARRSRRAVPVVLALQPPDPELERRGNEQGVEVVVAH